MFMTPMFGAANSECDGSWTNYGMYKYKCFTHFMYPLRARWRTVFQSFLKHSEQAQYYYSTSGSRLPFSQLAIGINLERVADFERDSVFRGACASYLRDCKGVSSVFSQRRLVVEDRVGH